MFFYKLLLLHFLSEKKELILFKDFLQLLKWSLFLAVFGTTLPPILFAIGIPKVGASTSGLLMTVALPMAVVSAYQVLNEKLSAIQLTGIWIMFLAIIAMNVINGRVYIHS